MHTQTKTYYSKEVNKITSNTDKFRVGGADIENMGVFEKKGWSSSKANMENNEQFLKCAVVIKRPTESPQKTYSGEDKLLLQSNHELLPMH